MKFLACTLYCLASYQSSLRLPEEIGEIQEAIRYAEEHVNEIPLGTLQYIPDSDELSETECEILEVDGVKALKTKKDIRKELLSREIFDFISGIKDLELQAKTWEDQELAHSLTRFADQYYPADAVKEILEEGEGIISGVQKLDEKGNPYYYLEGFDVDGFPYVFRTIENEDLDEILQFIERTEVFHYLLPKYSNFQFEWVWQIQEEETSHPVYFYPMVYGGTKLTAFLDKLQEWYLNDTNEKNGISEFIQIINGLLHGYVVLNPQYLDLDMHFEEWRDLLPNDGKKRYLETYEKIKKGSMPAVRSEYRGSFKKNSMKEL
ncbi:hypothetical protein H6B07_17435 [Mediterraneibacter glycyrrhizinilyticus]|nr:hypothetical protein [Mediterraneibacter glycyrrhizinilyticus]MBM6804394.1 hypothetical protein [Mediterraneibacter glycyrrhizinilyticus]